jgi:hypothetical protein
MSEMSDKLPACRFVLGAKAVRRASCSTQPAWSVRFENQADSCQLVGSYWEPRPSAERAVRPAGLVGSFENQADKLAACRTLDTKLLQHSPFRLKIRQLPLRFPALRPSPE